MLFFIIRELEIIPGAEKFFREGYVGFSKNIGHTKIIKGILISKRIRM